jgi:hypothetical protein
MLIAFSTLLMASVALLRRRAAVGPRARVS